MAATLPLQENCVAMPCLLSSHAISKPQSCYALLDMYLQSFVVCFIGSFSQVFFFTLVALLPTICNSLRERSISWMPWGFWLTEIYQQFTNHWWITKNVPHLCAIAFASFQQINRWNWNLTLVRQHEWIITSVRHIQHSNTCASPTTSQYVLFCVVHAGYSAIWSSFIPH